MNLSITTDYQTSIGDPSPYLKRIGDMGFTHIHWCHQWNTDFLYSRWEIDQIKKWLRKNQIQLLDLHGSIGPEKNWSSPHEYERQAGVELVKNRIEMTAQLGGKVTIMHVPNQPENRPLKKSLEQLEPFARARGVRIAVENTGNFDTVAGLLFEYDPDYLGLCYDSGHGNTNLHGLEYLARLKDRLISVHLHDNDGLSDQHKLPFTGSIDWLHLAQLLAGSAYTGLLSLEVSIHNTGIKDEGEFLKQAYISGVKLSHKVDEARKLIEQRKRNTHPNLKSEPMNPTKNKVKFGMNLLLWTDEMNDQILPVLNSLKEMGYDGGEIPLFNLDLDYSRWGQRLDDFGLERTAVTVRNVDDNPISPDQKVRALGVENNKKTIDCCQALGASVLAGPYHSALGVFSGQAPTKVERRYAVDGMRSLAAYAGQAGVTLALEYLNRFECYLINTASDLVDFVKEVDHPNCRAMFDTFHAHIEEKDVTQAIQNMAGVLQHVHISENDRGTPGTGSVRWNRIFKALRGVDYQGWLTVEAFGMSLPELTAATKIWRRMYDTEEQLARDALAFMKAGWAK